MSLPGLITDAYRLIVSYEEGPRKYQISALFKKTLGLPVQLLLKAVDLQYKNWSKRFVLHLSRGLLLLHQLGGAS